MILKNLVTEWTNSNNCCIDCKEPLGSPHKSGCVAYKRTVIIELKIPILVEVPVSWKEDDITLFYNDSSHCFDNIVNDLLELRRKLQSTDRCMCGIPKWGFDDGILYRREATEEDHTKFAYASTKVKENQNDN